MSTATIAPLPPLVQPSAGVRCSNAELDRMVESGLIREGSSTFLWAGEVIEPMPEGNPHNNAVSHLRRMLENRLPSESWTVNSNFAIDLAEGYRPQPDLSVLRYSRSLYRAEDRRPQPSDVVLLVEVSDTTYADDGGAFLKGYAWAGIPQYWIVNIRARRVEAYADPDPVNHCYRSRKDYGLDDRLPLSLTVEGVASEFEGIAVRDVLQDSLGQA